MARKAYPSDISNEEWALVAPYLTVMTEDAPQRVDTVDHLLAFHVTAGNEQDRRQVATLAAKVQEVTGDAVAVAFVDQGYTGEQAAQDAQDQHMHLEVVKLPEAKKGFVLLPRR
jgi:transposase